MPRLPSVTMNELEDMIDGAAVTASQMQGAADRIMQGYCQKPEKLVAKVMALNAVIGGASALLGALTQKLYLDELKTTTETEVRERVADRIARS